ncbi:hypothetical protein LU631_08770 [Erwinia tracheiphila]|uniref:Uncharacterized protein n=1 Tax=Erwinia tracheiphila TaxID=65700 RepID=A0A345CNL1_9GAMM|nr:hypothetical protein [Erwinia tracheiphila]AXF75028.1 hypothetical protein AV903_01105 [Erwinia tracheiphila]UIA89306.1 hypothetical protein LU631_08770 [Erwinia tracheiphila]UIA97689.1 hypothetical protein LU633_07455 [Erwinia tracheiphila]
MVICFSLAIAQIAQSGLSSFKVIDYPALLFSSGAVFVCLTCSSVRLLSSAVFFTRTRLTAAVVPAAWLLFFMALTQPGLV